MTTSKLELNPDIAPFWVGGDDKPPRNSQITAMNWMVENKSKKYLILEMPVGCHTAGTKIIKFDGSTVNVEDVQVGDMLLGPDSTPRKVLELCSGEAEMFELLLNNGESFTVNGEHILSLKSGTGKVVNISVYDYLLESDDFKLNYLMYRPPQINLEQTIEFQYDAYEFAINNKNSNDIRISDFSVPFSIKTGTPKLRNDYISGIVDSYGEWLHSDYIEDWLKSDLFGESYDIETNAMMIELTSELFCNDVIFVLRSLGFNVAKQSNTTIYFTGNFENLHRSNIINTSDDMFISMETHRVEFLVSLPLKFECYYGFKLSGDNLYMMDDFIVTHNSGKSLLGMTFSKYLGNSSYALTPQIILQKQYENDFENDQSLNLFSFYGKSNYTCYEKSTNCSIGSLVKPRCTSCPYSIARKAAKNSNNTVMNYALGFSHWAFTTLFTTDGANEVRRLMILDEAHKIESNIIKFSTIEINEKWCLDRNLIFPDYDKKKDVFEFIRDKYFPTLINAYEELSAELEFIKESKNSTATSASEIKKTKELNYLESQITVCDGLIRLDLSDIERDYVIVKKLNGIELKRLYGNQSFNTIVKPMADKFLMMSSTIIDKDEFCNDLGIDINEAAFISLESEFDPDNRPVVYMPKMKMNYGWDSNPRAKERESTIEAIRKIINFYPEENGIIHTGNFKIAEWLSKELELIKHKIIDHNPDSQFNRNEAIGNFLESDVPALLISPSITEGLDLKDDLARFAIFAKVPFGNIGDAWIKKRMQLSSEWYQRQALIDVIQGSGRVVRTPDDYGSTFILDESFGHLMNMNRHKIPKWWLDAYSKI